MEDVSLKLLILEDEVIDSKNFIEALKDRTDFILVGLTDSDTEALECVKSHQPDCIILDLELNKSESGNITSFNFLEKIRKLFFDYDPLIIVTTQIESKRIYNYIHSLGVDMILSKNHANYSSTYVLNMFNTLKDEYLQNSRKHPNATLLENFNNDIENTKDENERTLNIIKHELDLIGIKKDSSGGKYIINAIYDLIEYRKKHSNNYINIFMMLSHSLNIPYTTITGGVQYAINRAWNRSDPLELTEHYTARFDIKKGSPTPTEFVYYYVEKIEKLI